MQSVTGPGPPTSSGNPTVPARSESQSPTPPADAALLPYIIVGPEVVDAPECLGYYPIYSFPRGVAGEGIANDVIKVSAEDYRLGGLHGDGPDGDGAVASGAPSVPAIQ